MRERYELQERAIGSRIWHSPEEAFLPMGARVTADEVHILRDIITTTADTTTLSFWRHYRIVTRGGDPVERWRVRPGSAKQTRRRR